MVLGNAVWGAQEDVAAGVSTRHLLHKGTGYTEAHKKCATSITRTKLRVSKITGKCSLCAMDWIGLAIPSSNVLHYPALCQTSMKRTFNQIAVWRGWEILCIVCALHQHIFLKWVSLCSDYQASKRSSKTGESVLHGAHRLRKQCHLSENPLRYIRNLETGPTGI
jgi:hypothetical protein